jgi:short-subunit dehydrogenase
MKLVLAARREDKLHDVARTVKINGGEALIVPTDVADRGQVQTLVDKTVEHFGRLDVMFANAGFGHYAGVDGLDGPLDQRMWQVNYFGTVHCMQAAAAVFKPQGGGHLLMTSSVLAHLGLPFYSTYSATTAAQHGLAMSLRHELAGDGIDVTCVFPIGTRTEFFETARRLDGHDVVGQNTPEMFMQSARHVARRVIAALRHPRPEVWPSRLVHVAAAAFTMFPGLRQLALKSQAEKYRETR